VHSALFPGNLTLTQTNNSVSPAQQPTKYGVLFYITPATSSTFPFLNSRSVRDARHHLLAWGSHVKSPLFLPWKFKFVYRRVTHTLLLAAQRCHPGYAKTLRHHSNRTRAVASAVMACERRGLGWKYTRTFGVRSVFRWITRSENYLTLHANFRPPFEHNPMHFSLSKRARAQLKSRSFRFSIGQVGAAHSSAPWIQVRTWNLRFFGHESSSSCTGECLIRCS